MYGLFFSSVKADSNLGNLGLHVVPTQGPFTYPQALNCQTLSWPWDEMYLSNYCKRHEGT